MIHKKTVERIVSFTVSNREKKSIENFLSLNSFNPYKKQRPILKSYKQRFGAFPWQVDPNLASFVNNYLKDSSLVAAIINHLPVGNTKIPTPTMEFKTSCKRDYLSETLLLAMGLTLGNPYSYASEDKGFLVQNIFPVRKFADLQSAKGSVELTTHTELTCTQDPPDFLLLICLKKGLADAQTYTGIIALEDAVALLRQHNRNILKKLIFRTEIDPSMRRAGQNAIQSGPFAIIHKQRDGVRYQFDVEFTKTDDPDGKKLLRGLRETCRAVEQRFILEPGDLLIVKNKLAAHTRGAFFPRYDTTDRWLQRMIISRRLRRIAITDVI